MTEESHAELQAGAPPRFQFVRVLGRGVLGQTHEVIDEVRGEPVVLKIFLRCRPRNADHFRLEFESLARLEHPSLVRFHHLVDPTSDTNLDIENRLGTAGLAFTQEYVDGVDLLTWLHRPVTERDLTTLETRRTPTTGETPLTEEFATADVSGDVDTGSGELHTGEVGGPLDVASSIVEELAASSQLFQKPALDLVLLRLEQIVPQIVDGLKYLHRYHKVHGFLRPSNILVSKTGQCKMTDYGIVPSLAYRPPGESSREPISLLCAPEHLPYVAPELEGEATTAGDLYALGTVLFEAVAGFPPADAMEFVGGRARRLEVPPLAELVPECPAAWAERIDSLLRSDPQARPRLAAIGAVMGVEGRAVKLPPTVIPEPEGFVGQSKILDELRHEAHHVSEEETMRLVLLEGAAGVGKSLVTEEFAHWLSRRGWLVISGRCFNRESVPMQGWHEIARRLANVIDGLPPSLLEAVAADRRLAAVLFPALWSGAPIEGNVGRIAAIRALQRLLGFVGAQRPILLLLEDLHWASWDTASLLMDLFSETANVRCLIVGTWRTDSRRSDDHFLSRDLELSLAEVRRLAVSGFTSNEAREFLITHAPDAELADLRRILRAGRSNPRVLRELIWELDHDRLDERDLSLRGAELLTSLFAARMEDFDKPHCAMLHLLAVASGPLHHGWLCRAVKAELGGSVLPAEQTLDSIEAAFAMVEARRLVRRGEDTAHRTEWVIADDACREVVLADLSERDQARLAGRLADAIGDDRPDRHDLRFEYELRAAHVAKAIKAAVRAARVAESRFAYHRAAKLWRWLLEHQEKLDDPTVNPGAELARAEHLAGQHAEAAELYQSWAASTTDRLRRATIRRDEAAAWLQAGDSGSAVAALDAAFRDFGQTYVSKWHAAISETPRRLVATLVRWNEKLAERVRPGAAEKGELVLASLYEFALEYNDWLDSSRAPEIEARLARLASGAEDALILGLHRSRVGLLHAGDGIISRRGRAFGWMDEAERIIAPLDDPGRLGHVHLNRAILHMRYGEYAEARERLELLGALHGSSDEVERTDRRWTLFCQATLELRQANLARAEALARQLLHAHRGDHLASSSAYSVLTEVALLRGEAQFAAVFLDAGKKAIDSSTPSAASSAWYLPQAQLHVALGRPEVAVGQLQVEVEALAKTPFSGDPRFEVPLQLGLGQAAAALAERQRVLAEPRQDATRALLRVVRRRLEPHLDDLNGRRRAEVLRLLARIDLVAGKPRRALKHADAAIEALGVLQAPIDMARCMEARGVVLARLERGEARGIIQQAWELYRQYGVSYPLIVEGWPAPREATTLQDD